MIYLIVRLEYGSVEKRFANTVEAYAFMRSLGRTVISYDIGQV